ncbi:MAG: pilus assembly protein [Vicinamibacterales bacterium]|nr:pilus assembly protein [Vicinamibacterales bacterium]
MGDARERGAALVEFALVSLVLYLLLAGTIEFGRLMFDANALQDVARVAARELALAPVRANATFDYALSCDATADPDCLVDLKSRIFDPACLVVDLSDPAVAADPDGFFAAMPVVNRALRTLMITEPQRPNLLRYAGALLSDASGTACSAIGPNEQAAATGLTVGIPLVEARDANGVESITWVPVLQEIRAAGDAECPSRGPFSLVYISTDDACGPLDADPLADRGLAAVRINYPYQAATLSGFQPSVPTDVDPLPPNIANVITAEEGAVQELNAAPGGTMDDGAIGPYAGAFGLGRQLALAGRTVRPFRKQISVQAINRREVVE